MPSFLPYIGICVIPITLVSSFSSTQSCNIKSHLKLYSVVNDNDLLWNNLIAPEGLSKMEVVMTPEFFISNGGALKKLYSNCIKSTEVKESSIAGAGKGLFATKNIKAGSIISFYPAHALGIDNGIKQIFVSQRPSDEEYFRENPCESSSYLHATDQPIFNRPSFVEKIQDSGNLKDFPLFLDVNPNRDVDGCWVSQMINDGASVKTQSEEGILTYYKESKKRKNCIHIPFGPSPVMATIATRKIKKGEEIFTSYGCTYWALDVGITPRIQLEINDSAKDLLSSMKLASSLYRNELEEIEAAYNKIENNS